MNGEDLLNKRLELAYTQAEMTEAMQIPLPTYIRLENGREKRLPRKYELILELVEMKRREELPTEELAARSAQLRSSYEQRIASRTAKKNPFPALNKHELAIFEKLLEKATPKSSAETALRNKLRDWITAHKA